MTKTLKSRIARLEETHRHAVLQHDTSAQELGEAAIERIHQILGTFGIEREPAESLAETFARALGIGTDKLMSYLYEVAHGDAS